MTWTKLDNPKPGASSLAKDAVKVVARAAMKNSRFIIMKIGETAAQRGSFRAEKHKCHVMIGSGEDAGKLAIVLDDSAGKFEAKRKKDGRYELTIRASAAEGKFNLTFPPFERTAVAFGVGNGPAAITFPAGDGFLIK